MPKSLDELFDAFEKRKEAQALAAAQKSARIRREREMALATIRERIVPTLRALGEKIRERGHQSTVHLEALEDEHPSVILDFTPAESSAGSPPPAISRVRFAWTGGETLETLHEVAHSPSRQVIEKVWLRDVNEDWTRRQALWLVEAALERH